MKELFSCYTIKKNGTKSIYKKQLVGFCIKNFYNTKNLLKSVKTLSLSFKKLIIINNQE